MCLDWRSTLPRLFTQASHSSSLLICFNLVFRMYLQLGYKNATSILPGKFHGQRSLVGYSPWSHKELDMTEQLTHTHTHTHNIHTHNRYSLPYSLDETMYCCCCLVAQPWATLCDPMSCSTPGFSVLHYLLEFPQTLAHCVDDVIQPCITFYFIFVL